MTASPKRLIDLGSRASPELRALMRTGRDDVPDDARVQTIAAGLVPLLGAAHLGGALQAGASGVRPAVSATKIAGAVKAAGALKAGALAVTVLGVAAGGYATVHSVAAPTAETRAPAAHHRAAAPVAAPWTPVPAWRAVDPDPSFTLDPGPPSVPTADEGPTAPSEAELSELATAEDALGWNPALALHLADLDGLRLPKSAVAPEREVIAIDALVRLDRIEEARGRAARFARNYPGSAYLAHVAALVAVP